MKLSTFWKTCFFTCCLFNLHIQKAGATFSFITNFVLSAQESGTSIPRPDELELLAKLPIIPQEMRGSWLVTVHNIDWPSKPGISVVQQKTELLSLLDRANKLGLNAVLFQVRDVADAFYPSEIEPWSVFLTGEQGLEPEPFWDPLQFAIEEAHKRGLELHAWLNPYRVGYLNQSRFDPKHIFRQRPDLVRLYNDSYWLDPGNPDSEAHILRVVQDIVSRYKDLDGIHYDDYFYPYPKAGFNFRDDVTKKAYAESETLAHWRRQNINRLIEKTYRLVKRINPYLSFGVSPFGIWRNNQPSGVRGLESYHELYADSRKWLHQGWVDYMAPQFYWVPDAPKQPYERMLDWWLAQNTQDKLVMAGINIANLKTVGNVEFRDVLEKVSLRREYRGDGEIYYSLGKINTMEWQENVRSLYPYQALPALVGPDRPPLPAPKLAIELDVRHSDEDENLNSKEGKGWRLSWKPNSFKSSASGLNINFTVKYWAVYYMKEGIWNYRIYPGWVQGIKVNLSRGLDPRYFAVAAVDKGNAIGNVSWFGSIPVDMIEDIGKEISLANH